jgi:hypothetical protein
MARLSRDIVEIIRALAVLALVFLNFAHAPLALAGEVSGAAVFCGDAPADAPDGSKAKEPCPACRIGEGVALPDVPCAVSRAARILPVAHADVTNAVVPSRRHTAAVARGPPAA